LTAASAAVVTALVCLAGKVADLVVAALVAVVAALVAAPLDLEHAAPPAFDSGAATCLPAPAANPPPSPGG
jgi:hypothetical protein